MIARLIAGIVLSSMITLPMHIVTAKNQKVKVEFENVEITKETYFTIETKEAEHISNKNLRLTTKYDKEISKKKEIKERQEKEKQEQAAVSQINTQPIVINNLEAKERVAQYESSGRYDAVNGRYYGRYQLDQNYLNGDYSIENQEKTAEAYVLNRYGNWAAAWQHIQEFGWY